MENAFPQTGIGILAYGSLVGDPGAELEPLIIDRIPCQTPFNVEYARLSKTRDMAPTVVPTWEKDGAPVAAVILVLAASIAEDDAATMLWRRETGKVGSTLRYVPPAADSKDGVRVERLVNFAGVDTVLYTKIPSNMGIMNTPNRLAHFAIESALSGAGADGRDGITYLANNIKNGIITPHTKAYEQEILSQTGAKDLESAKAKLDPLRKGYLQQKQAWKSFEADVRAISDMIFAVGIDATLPDSITDGKAAQEFLKHNMDQFLINCHTGFKKGQERIISLILELQEDRIQNKQELKTAHASKNKARIFRLKQQAKEIDHKEKILRHLVDGIVWQITGGQLYISRQLYKEVEDTKILSSSNVESVLKVAARINDNPRDFALLTDLTSYVQIGDLLVVQHGIVSVAEVKEGEKNIKNIEIIEELGPEMLLPPDIAEKHMLDDKDMKQLRRQLRQLQEMENFTNILRTDEGVELETGRPYKVLTPKEPTPYFIDRLSALEEQLKTRNLWGYDVIEGCLHIGITKGPFRDGGPILLKSIAEQKGFRYIIINYLQVLESLNRPIVNLPFTTDFIFDILFGRVIVLMMLDLDAYIALASEVGLRAEWASRKETAKMKDRGAGKSIFLNDNQAIRVTVNLPSDTLPEDMTIYISAGMLTKIFFDFIMPSYTLYSYWYYFELMSRSDQNQGDDNGGIGENKS
ncbi:MAG TPA: hypothetical protein VG605_24280 [Puia sp.]|nr:hypothetical protein [Puia sp.]